MHYFSMDGNYGDADGIIVTNTDNWTEEMWELVEECSDSDRVDIVKEILKEIENKK